MRFYQAIILLMIIAVMAAGCASDSGSDDTSDLKIYTSLYPIQYAAEQIGGKSVDVTSVYPPGADAHTYEPSVQDLTAIADSDAFIYLGNGMEAFAETAAEALSSQDVTLVELGKKKSLFQGGSDQNEARHSGHHHDYNPHIWLDPKRMIAMSEMIKTELIHLHPNEADTYRQNFKELEYRLLALDDAFQETLANKSQKKILVSHAAYGYWEDRYGIEQIPISGLSSSEEPSQKDLTTIIDQANAYDLDYLLFEQNTPDRVANIIQDHIDAKSLFIHNLSVLTESDIQHNDDYESLMNHNLEVLDQATE